VAAASTTLAGSESRPTIRAAHRPTGSSLLARQGLVNRRCAARALATVVYKPGERVRELVAAGDLELAVDAVQMRLGGLGRDEQRLRDLAIGEALGGETCDPQLAGGQRVAAGDRVASWLGAGGDQLRARLVGDSPCTAVVGEIERSLELSARLDAAAGAPQRRAVVGSRAGELDRRERAL